MQGQEKTQIDDKSTTKSPSVLESVSLSGGKLRESSEV